MNFKYKNVSAGYVGIQYEHATINSSFYAEFLRLLDQNPTIMQKPIIFPQRIPRRGFFEELYSLETDEFRHAFDLIITKMKAGYQLALNKMMHDECEAHVREFINWGQLLMRFGEFSTIFHDFPHKYFGKFALEVSLLKNSAHTESLLSDDKPISVKEQIDIFKNFHTLSTTTTTERLIILNNIIVNFYRYQINIDLENEVFNLSNLFFELIEKLSLHNFKNIFYASIGYRALAMVTKYHTDQLNQFLFKAHSLAKTIKYNSNLEKILAEDNLYTCQQSLSKWYLHNKNLHMTETCLKELISIDPQDSTGYSEIGFYYFNLKKYDEACNYFLLSKKYGPPGIGMNTYFYAKSYEQIFGTQKSLPHLYESATLDKFSVSAWLDIFNYYHVNNKKILAKSVSMHVIFSPILNDQLEDHEKNLLESYLF